MSTDQPSAQPTCQKCGRLMLYSSSHGYTCVCTPIPKPSRLSFDAQRMLGIEPTPDVVDRLVDRSRYG